MGDKSPQKQAKQRTGKGFTFEVVLLDGEHVNIELDVSTTAGSGYVSSHFCGVVVTVCVCVWYFRRKWAASAVEIYTRSVLSAKSSSSVDWCFSFAWILPQVRRVDYLYQCVKLPGLWIQV